MTVVGPTHVPLLPISPSLSLPLLDDSVGGGGRRAARAAVVGEQCAGSEIRLNRWVSPASRAATALREREREIEEIC